MNDPAATALRATVLIVDDVAANRNLLRETLEPKGYEVLMAPNGETALKVAQRALPEVILLDINMPGLDGFETCRRLKSQERTRDLPVIFITANDGSESLVDGFHAGAVDYITKPFKAEEVLMRVETHLNIDRLTRTLRRKNEELIALNEALQEEILLRQQAEQSLSLMEEQQTERFHIGGTLRHDARSYVERRADRELLQHLLERQFCYVLTSRQMGKSSLMVRTAHHLRRTHVAVVTLDLTAIGQNVTPEQWYDGLISRLGWQLQLEDELEAFWAQNSRFSPVQRFFTSLRHVLELRSSTPLIIFVDELDMVRSLPFATDEFFAAIREGYNRRSEEEELNRLTFCLLGVATPSELIENSRITPFNIGHRIELTDFTCNELVPLSRGLGRSPSAAEELIERIYFWTSGHPYLTQKLCKAVAQDQRIQTASALDDICHQLLLSPQAREQDDNLIFVREHLLRSHLESQNVLTQYRAVRNGEPVPLDETDPAANALRLAGVVRVDGGFLKPRNRIYEHVFDLKWIAAHTRRGR